MDLNISKNVNTNKSLQKQNKKTSIHTLTKQLKRKHNTPATLCYWQLHCKTTRQSIVWLKSFGHDTEIGYSINDFPVKWVSCRAPEEFWVALLINCLLTQQLNNMNFPKVCKVRCWSFVSLLWPRAKASGVGHGPYNARWSLDGNWGTEDSHQSRSLAAAETPALCPKGQQKERRRYMLISRAGASDTC